MRAGKKSFRQAGIKARKVADTLSPRGDTVVYTGTIDSYYDYRFGKLEYRSLRFESEILDTENYQGVAVVNYTDRETPYTRVIEHKHFEFGTQPKTVITREYPDAYRETLVVLDGTTGQNALAQARQFMEAADVTGIILTKLDGTAKGGIAVAIQSELGIPVKYIGIGEKIDDLQKFDADAFINALFA